MDRARNSHRSPRGESRMTILAKIVSLLSLTRVYNIALIAAAQYLSCIFFFTSRPPDFSVLTDPHFFVLVVCTWMTIAAGYIINFFYDKNKDLVNSPVKSRIDGFVSQATTLKLYLTLNALAVAASLYVSLRSGVFFAGFAFLLWFYSHKLKKIPLVSNLSLAAVAIVPLFAVFFYRKIVDIQVVVSHGLFLFFLLVAMSLLNDLNNRRGDAVFGYRTLPVVWGERAAAPRRPAQRRPYWPPLPLAPPLCWSSSGETLFFSTFSWQVPDFSAGRSLCWFCPQTGPFVRSW